VDEVEAGDPAEVARENAVRKARAVAGGAAAATVLGVDTVVAVDGAVFGKPADETQATAMLRALAGRTHEVLSGLCVIDRDGERSGVASTAVTFRELDDAAVARYVATGEWRDRAGGYAIQERGAVLVRRISGDYLNVVGLPVALLVQLLPDLG
jgi:septum formation protein